VSTDTKPVLVMAAEDRYAMPMGVALRSIQENLRSDFALDVHILDGGIRWCSRHKLTASVDPSRLRLHWIRPGRNTTRGLPVFGHIRPAAYYRIMIPDLLGEGVKRAVYIDCDTLIVGDISPLWDMPFDGSPLLAVQDGHATISHPTVKQHFVKSDLAPETPYLNSGMLVLNMDMWREEGLTRQILNYLVQHHDRVRYWDQDGINAILVGRWTPLGGEWNTRVDCADVEDTDWAIPEGAVILHYASSMKPWEEDARHPAVDLFRRGKALTPWAKRGVVDYVDKAVHLMRGVLRRGVGVARSES